MAFYDMSQTATSKRLGRMVTQLVSSLMAWREECATRDVLGKLTDHELNDIGLLRGDPDQVSSARQPDD
ncbi:DUF1127 domain-containing protein [Aliiruegeria lutimaris]|uniref:Uncharacterized conserved protein YjiS, DUF1127 family n=1 Tax=Aliiruegeria lutimaris TaxID=571298 RepID=A0A1G8LS31_9RHOB|nr:DUF1127 domain-containing protein [Aliiruegeria lutimaris]SDI58512.1 Uncharacterized conserved protein YjiS, DUF1127 family [Aliiruegeria lutimaris]